MSYEQWFNPKCHYSLVFLLLKVARRVSWAIAIKGNLRFQQNVHYPRTSFGFGRYLVLHLKRTMIKQMQKCSHKRPLLFMMCWCHWLVPAQAACKGSPVPKPCTVHMQSLEGLLSQQQWPEPGGETGQAESRTVTSSHAKVTFMPRDRLPPSGCLTHTGQPQLHQDSTVIHHCFHNFWFK